MSVTQHKGHLSEIIGYYPYNYEKTEISNIKQTHIILKEVINFNKNYQRNDILKILNKTLNKRKSIFII